MCNMRRRSDAFLCFIINAYIPFAASLSSPRLLIVGLGRVGLEVARQSLAPVGNFSQILGTTRQPTTAAVPDVIPLHTDREDSNDDGIQRVSFLSLTTSHVESSSHILFTIPAPDSAAWKVIENVIAPALNKNNNEEPSSSSSSTTTTGGSKWIGVISTTGVYGDHNGEWVTEESDSRCEADSSAGRLLEFETFWKRQTSLASSPVRVRVFRSAGIYGNDRSALHTVYRQGLPVERDPPSSSNHAKGNDVTNRIHEEDLAAAIVASMLGSEADKFEVFNVADNLPESRRVVMDYAASILRNAGLNVGEQTLPARRTSGRTKRRETERKMVCNSKMRQNLIRELKYPTYKEGLASILQSPGAPWRRQSMNAEKPIL